jgi:hypothetical protein
MMTGWRKILDYPVERMMTWWRKVPDHPVELVPSVSSVQALNMLKSLTMGGSSIENQTQSLWFDLLPSYQAERNIAWSRSEAKFTSQAKA